MSVRVVARIRPLLKNELDKDTIIEALSTDDSRSPKSNIIRIPNPKNLAEDFSFQFNSVYDQDSTQQDIFDNEVSPTIKHLFNGFDITLFAYGVTGTGKTHTMRGGKSLADRGVIPRLLSAIYRRCRKIEKDSEGRTTVEVAMSYYEIYNDRVFDLFEAPEKRTATGLPLRELNGKTMVVGLTERPCTSLKEFETLYDQANVNRSTSATKLNAHSSRSHAILCVKLSVTTGDETRISMASAIDLAGSEDNRRTDNGKERMVESASINKSLFVLAQCVEAISKKQQRIPYRESKMTRILSLGQNNGLTIMILNLAPVKSYHLDTLSSLNFANRTKKIEVREVENEPIFKGAPRATAHVMGPSIQRQPLRPLATAHNANVNQLASANNKQGSGKPTKSFSVYSDKNKSRNSNSINSPRRKSPLKRSSESMHSLSRPAKAFRPNEGLQTMARAKNDISKESIEQMVEKKVEEILAARALNEPTKSTVPDISEEVQRRLEMLEQRIENKEDSRAEGLTYLLMAKQHHVRGEDVSALKMYQLALPYFPDNEKLASKMLALQEKLRLKREQEKHSTLDDPNTGKAQLSRIVPSLEKIQPSSSRAMNEIAPRKVRGGESDEDDDFAPEAVSDSEAESDSGVRLKQKPKKATKSKLQIFRDGLGTSNIGTPRTKHLLHVINTRDVAQIRSLKGVGAKKAEAIVDCLCSLDEDNLDDDSQVYITSLEQLGRLKGVGLKTVENMRAGLII